MVKKNCSFKLLLETRFRAVGRKTIAVNFFKNRLRWKLQRYTSKN